MWSSRFSTRWKVSRMICCCTSSACRGETAGGHPWMHVPAMVGKRPVAPGTRLASPAVLCCPLLAQGRPEPAAPGDRPVPVPPMGDPGHPEGRDQDTGRTPLWRSDRPCSRDTPSPWSPTAPAALHCSRSRSGTGLRQPLPQPHRRPRPRPGRGPVAHQVLVEADEPRLPVVVEHEDGVDHPGGRAGPGWAGSRTGSSTGAAESPQEAPRSPRKRTGLRWAEPGVTPRSCWAAGTIKAAPRRGLPVPRGCTAACRRRGGVRRSSQPDGAGLEPGCGSRCPRRDHRDHRDRRSPRAPLGGAAAPPGPASRAGGGAGNQTTPSFKGPATLSARRGRARGHRRGQSSPAAARSRSPAAGTHRPGPATPPCAGECENRAGQSRVAPGAGHGPLPGERGHGGGHRGQGEKGQCAPRWAGRNGEREREQPRGDQEQDTARPDWLRRLQPRASAF